MSNNHTKAPRTAAKALTRLVCIQGNTYGDNNTVGVVYAAYKGKERLEVAAFDRPLEADEVEYYRKYPEKFVESLEVVEVTSSPEGGRLEVQSQDSTFEDEPELA